MTLFPVAPYRAAGSFFAGDPAGGGMLSEEGSSESPFLFSLCGVSEASRFGLRLPGLPGPGPRVTFVRTKVTKKRQGDPGPPFLSNRSLRD